ncbi:Hypothetical protein, putative [Bodo saltans]|uniref:Uncharacterized protein n=1 Tax=Bodo saltans TaxID=75058 RepID=A0A0S4J6Y9_BODSA|nr:Hypothetical protein, putative [Bodo saltans]|eukprot:CUG85407.1 Hypothetical protein, putative [Bodo saltans]
MRLSRCIRRAGYRYLMQPHHLSNGRLPFEYLQDALVGGRQWYFASHHTSAVDVGVCAAVTLSPGDTVDLECPSLLHFDAVESLHPSSWLSLLDATPSSVDELHGMLHRRRSVSNSNAIVFCEHSCAPSLIIDGESCRSSQSLVIGSKLTHSQLNAAELYMSTSVRRDLLALQHGVPMCRCVRCTAAVDSSRLLRCDCDGFKQAESSMWHCRTCNGVWTDAEITSLHKEEALSKSVYELWSFLTRVLSVQATLSKNTFQTLKDIVLQAETYLGIGHWVSLMAAKCAIAFYEIMLRISPGARSIVETMIRGWLQHAVRCAQKQQLFATIPWHVSRDLGKGAGLLESLSHAQFLRHLEKLFEDARYHRRTDQSCLRVVYGSCSPHELLQQWEEALLARIGEDDATRNYMLQRL